MSKARRGRGEGSIRQLESGGWRAWVSLGRDPVTGKRVRDSRVFATKKEALDWRDERRARKERPSQTTVGEWCDDWLSRREGALDPVTHGRYARAIRLKLRPYPLAAVKLGDLSARHIESWLADLAAASQTPGNRRHALEVLRRALKDAVRHEKLRRNFASDVQGPRVEPREIRPLDDAELSSLLAAVAFDPYRAWYYLQLDAGLRPGESYALHWPQVDLGPHPHVRIERSRGTLAPDELKPAKTRRSRRTVPISRRTAAELEAHRARMKKAGRDVIAGPVFLTDAGGLLHPSAFNRTVVAPAYRRAGIRNARPYDLRHTSATHLLAAGVNIRVVSERLGHTSIAITLTYYASYLPGMQQTAADRMDELFNRWHTAGTPTPEQPT